MKRKICIIYAHPYNKSYNHAILKNVVEELEDIGCNVDVIDLYKDNFSPSLSEKGLSLYRQGKYADPMVGQYQKRLGQAHEIIFIFPVWWGTAPAILKGFIDKVFIEKWAFDTQGIMLEGRLVNIQKATIITTMNVSSLIYNLFYSTAIKGVVKQMLKVCGIRRIKWIKLTKVGLSNEDKRKKWIEKIRNYLRKTITKKMDEE